MYLLKKQAGGIKMIVNYSLAGRLGFVQKSGVRLHLKRRVLKKKLSHEGFSFALMAFSWNNPHFRSFFVLSGCFWRIYLLFAE